ncbi:MAG: DUF839 domain-containing protein [Dehalococcoidia bacterium]|nr:DUF839 domain-containing protein [Dehalococcoidia bacterium]
MTLEQKRLNRRNFLRGSAVIAGAVASAPMINPLGVLAATQARVQAGVGEGGYGPLEPVADHRDGGERLALPSGFEYRSLGLAGSTMADGNLTPIAHDGMAAFALPNGSIRLIRNHEDRNPPGAGTAGGPAATRYDQLAGGGTTTLDVDPTTRELVNDFLSLNGTTVNCAGGPTPWGSWLTCEETTVGPPAWPEPHGYVFEVPTSANGTVPATPLNAMGRFVHEAVAVDPRTGFIYETEDDGNQSGFYRFLPAVDGNLQAGGRLQMLAVRGRTNYDTTTGQRPGRPLPVEWVDVEDPDPAAFTPHAVFLQGYEKGGANFARLEGCWYGDGSIFLNSTSGGDAGLGQVWEYRPRGRSGGQLILVYESPSAEVLDSPDNICVSPSGGLVLCEDGSGDQYVRGLTQRGQIFDLGLNLANTFEWAGATFSPDGETMFVNIQGATSGPNPPVAGAQGMTVAIWGPWGEGAL